MKQVLFSLSLFLQMGILQAQSIDNELERAARQVVYDVIDENIAPDIDYVGVVIMDKNGGVKANVSLQYDSIAKFRDYLGGNGRYYGCFAACILSADNPAYSIGKHNHPAGRALPSQIARALIDWIAKNYLHRQAETNESSNYPKRRRMHPAEK